MSLSPPQFIRPSDAAIASNSACLLRFAALHASLKLAKPGVSTTTLRFRSSFLPTCGALACSGNYHSPPLSKSTAECRASLEALIFDCDGVILESEDLHRRAYNATFSHFDVRCPPATEPVDWNSDFYDQLQNRIGGGKPKMRWYFNTYGWPSSKISATPPVTYEEKDKLIDILQDWKTEKYKDIIGSGTVEPRPGVLQLMDEAQSVGVKVAVCSASTKSSVIFCLTNLLGKERFEQLDCFLAGDDVEKKKPDPSIYMEAAKRLDVPAKRCLVVEDSIIGLQAAVGAGMGCIISYTSSTQEQDFRGAWATYPDLGTVSLQHLLTLMNKPVVAP